MILNVFSPEVAPFKGGIKSVNIALEYLTYFKAFFLWEVKELNILKKNKIHKLNIS